MFVALQHPKITIKSAPQPYEKSLTLKMQIYFLFLYYIAKINLS